MIVNGGNVPFRIDSNFAAERLLKNFGIQRIIDLRTMSSGLKPGCVRGEKQVAGTGLLQEMFHPAALPRTPPLLLLQHLVTLDCLRGLVLVAELGVTAR